MWERARVCAKSLQFCPTLCDPVYCRLPGSSVHGILQVRTLQWVAMPSSRGSSQPRDRTFLSCVFCIAREFFTAEPQGKPIKETKRQGTNQEKSWSQRKSERVCVCVCVCGYDVCVCGYDVCVWCVSMVCVSVM